MTSTLLIEIFLIVFLGAFILAMRLRTKLGDSPRELQVFNKKLFYVVAGLMWLSALFLVWSGKTRNAQDIIRLAMFILLPLSLAYQAFRKRTDSEILENYDHDSRHCGRCDYDLTGNVSGVCPECEWKMPEQPIPYQRLYWACWWKGWQIDHLDNWLKMLSLCSIMGIMFTGAALWIWLYSNLPLIAAPIPAVFALGFWLNVIRIITYARRCSPTGGQAASGTQKRKSSPSDE